MAANFGAESTEVREMGSSASPQAGVVKEPLGLQAASDVFARVGDALKARKEGKNQSALSEFTKQQLLVAEGVSQGKYKSAFAQTLIRQNLLNAIDANPLLTGDLVKAHSAVTGLSGVNEYLEDGTEAEQRQKRRFDQLVDANLLPHNASQSQFSSADEAARIAQAASDRYELRSKSLQAERDALAVGSARRAAVEEMLKNEANQLVAAATPAEMARIQTTLQGYLDSDMPVADKVNAIRDFITTTKAQAAETLGTVDSARREQVEAIVTRLEQDYIDRATGKISDSVFEANKKRIETELDMQLLANPELARAASLTRVMGPEGATQMIIKSGNARVYDMVNSFLAGGDVNSDVQQPSFFTSDKTTTQAMKIALDTLAESVTSSDPTIRENATRHVQKAMQNIEDASGTISRDPKKAIALIDWLASPAFLKARRANPDAFANLEGVEQVLETNYHDEVRGLIKREFTESKVFVRSKTPTRSGREAVPTNELVEAVGTEGGMTFQAIDSDNADARKEAARLNKELKPIINNSIKAATHLSGTTNYKQAWEETAESILGVGAGGDADLPGGDADDDLTMADFAKGISAVEPLADTEVNVIESGLPSGGTMERVSGMILHHTGGRGTVEGVINTLKQRNLSVQYVIDRDGKVHQLMPDNAIAWHAGKNNTSNYNNKTSPGVEIIAKDDSDVLPQQVEAAQRLVRSLADKYGFDPVNDVKGHGEVASHKQATEGMSTLTQIRG